MISIIFLVLGLLVTVLILMVAFQNVSAFCSYLVIFFTPLSNSQISVTSMVLITALAGAIAGFFFTSFVYTLLFRRDEDEEVELDDKGEQGGNF